MTAHQTQITLQVKDLVTGDTHEYIWWVCETVSLTQEPQYAERRIGPLGWEQRMVALDVTLGLHALPDDGHDRDIVQMRHIEAGTEYPVVLTREEIGDIADSISAAHGEFCMGGAHCGCDDLIAHLESVLPEES